MTAPKADAVFHYDFRTGAAAPDVVVSGGYWVDDRVTGAPVLYFPRKAQFSLGLTVAHALNFQPMSSYTVVMDVNFEQYPPSLMPLIWHTQYVEPLTINKFGVVSCRMMQQSTPEKAIPLGKWCRLTLAVDVSSARSTVTIYVDEVVVLTGVIPSSMDLQSQLYLLSFGPVGKSNYTPAVALHSSPGFSIRQAFIFPSCYATSLFPKKLPDLTTEMALLRMDPVEMARYQPDILNAAKTKSTSTSSSSSSTSSSSSKSSVPELNTASASMPPTLRLSSTQTEDDAKEREVTLSATMTAVKTRPSIFGYPKSYIQLLREGSYVEARALMLPLPVLNTPVRDAIRIGLLYARALEPTTFHPARFICTPVAAVAFSSKDKAKDIHKELALAFEQDRNREPQAKHVQLLVEKIASAINKATRYRVAVLGHLTDSTFSRITSLLPPLLTKILKFFVESAVARAKRVDSALDSLIAAHVDQFERSNISADMYNLSRLPRRSVSVPPLGLAGDYQYNEMVDKFVEVARRRVEKLLQSRQEDLDKATKSAEEAKALLKVEYEAKEKAAQREVQLMKTQAYAAMLKLIIADGIVSDDELRLLLMYRKEHTISDEEHEAALETVPMRPQFREKISKFLLDVCENRYICPLITTEVSEASAPALLARVQSVRNANATLPTLSTAQVGESVMRAAAATAEQKQAMPADNTFSMPTSPSAATSTITASSSSSSTELRSNNPIFTLNAAPESDPLPADVAAALKAIDDAEAARISMANSITLEEEVVAAGVLDDDSEEEEDDGNDEADSSENAGPAANEKANDASAAPVSSPALMRMPSLRRQTSEMVRRMNAKHGIIYHIGTDAHKLAWSFGHLMKTNPVEAQLCQGRVHLGPLPEKKRTKAVQQQENGLFNKLHSIDQSREAAESKSNTPSYLLEAKDDPTDDPIELLRAGESTAINKYKQQMFGVPAHVFARTALVDVSFTPSDAGLAQIWVCARRLLFHAIHCSIVTVDFTLLQWAFVMCILLHFLSLVLPPFVSFLYPPFTHFFYPSD